MIRLNIIYNGSTRIFAWLLKQDKRNHILVNNLKSRPNCLYFDANCLFHPQCFKILKSFPFESNVDKLEEMMMERIINYIDYLISYVNPTDLVYIAVDGVAPLAKINQQRKRRYKSIEENQMKNNIYKKYNIPNNTNWSNIVITPGTNFMKKLDKKIKEYIRVNKYKIIYSSYEERGEGEHKIFQYIKNNYKKNEKQHIIYGLDADLIFLSLSCDYENLYLLREKQHFGKNNKEEDKNTNPITDVKEELTFVSIDNSRLVFNNYFKRRLDIQDLDQNQNDEKIDFIDDFVFLCYFLGNDFIPHIPSISIRNDGIDLLFDAYLYSYERCGEKIITVNKSNKNISYSKTGFKLFLEFLSEMERSYFKKNKHKNNFKSAPSNLKPVDKELWELENLVSINKNIDDDPFKLYSEFIDLDTAKTNYYYHYFHMKFNLKNQIKNITKSFVVTLKWVGMYYFDKAPSWNLQYDYDAAPFVSDLYDNYEQFFDVIIEKSDESFNIEQQLLSVIPPKAKYVLDKTIQKKNG